MATFLSFFVGYFLIGVAVLASLLVPLLWEKERREWFKKRWNDDEGLFYGWTRYPIFIGLTIVAWPIVILLGYKRDKK